MAKYKVGDIEVMTWNNTYLVKILDYSDRANLDYRVEILKCLIKTKLSDSLPLKLVTHCLESDLSSSYKYNKELLIILYG